MRLRLTLLAAIVAALAALPPAAAGSIAHPTRVAGNPADRMLSTPIDEERYDNATRCVSRPQPGMVALQRWLERNWRGQSWGIVRCGRLSRDNFSLHSEGRALDWHLDARNPRDRRAAERLIELLLAPDREGNEHALARRMGVQELIWNCGYWGAFGQEGMGRYSSCYTASGRRKPRVDFTQAHKDHIHIGINRAGAQKRTSFWRGR